MLVDRLRKHAEMSSALRHSALEKTALLGRLVGKAGAFVLSHPIKTLIGLGGAVAASSKYQQAKMGFRPDIHKKQLGIDQELR